MLYQINPVLQNSQSDDFYFMSFFIYSGVCKEYSLVKRRQLQLMLLQIETSEAIQPFNFIGFYINILWIYFCFWSRQLQLVLLQFDTNQFNYETIQTMELFSYYLLNQGFILVNIYTQYI